VPSWTDDVVAILVISVCTQPCESGSAQVLAAAVLDGATGIDTTPTTASTSSRRLAARIGRLCMDPP
jgi:hypothetical protein